MSGPLVVVLHELLGVVRLAPGVAVVVSLLYGSASVVALLRRFRRRAVAG